MRSLGVCGIITGKARGERASYFDISELEIDGGEEMSQMLDSDKLILEKLANASGVDDWLELLNTIETTLEDVWCIQRDEQTQIVFSYHLLDFLKAGVKPARVIALLNGDNIVRWYPELVEYGAEIDLEAVFKEVNASKRAGCLIPMAEMVRRNAYRLIDTGVDVDWLVKMSLGNIYSNELAKIVVFKGLGASDECLLEKINEEYAYRKFDRLVDVAGLDPKAVFDKVEPRLKEEVSRFGMSEEWYDRKSIEKGLKFLYEKGVLDEDAIYGVIKIAEGEDILALMKNHRRKIAGVKVTPEWLFENTNVAESIYRHLRDKNNYVEEAMGYVEQLGLDYMYVIEHLSGRDLFYDFRGHLEKFDKFLRNLSEDAVKALGRQFYEYCRNNRESLDGGGCLEMMLALFWHGAEIEPDLFYKAFDLCFGHETDVWSDYHARVALQMLDAGINRLTVDEIAEHLDYERLVKSGERFEFYRALEAHGADEKYLKKLRVC